MKTQKGTNTNSKLWSNNPRHHKDNQNKPPQTSQYSKFILLLFPFFLIIFYLFYVYPLNLHLISSCTNLNPKTPTLHLAKNIDEDDDDVIKNITIAPSTTPPPPIQNSQLLTTQSNIKNTTKIYNIVFGIAASSNLWDRRKDYIKIWWKPRMRGFVWLDKPVQELQLESGSNQTLPKLKISGDTSNFPYKHPRGHRSAIRISRIVSETFKLDLPDVHWFVMGDDDTVFFPDNLLAVLNKFDHEQPYYIGAPSESHLQNIYFSYNMAYGGGGFAISRPLAAMLSVFQDRCIRRYPALYGSDDRIQACMAELGVPLTKHFGFHQYDVYGDLLGLLAAHPVAPLVSIHHLDVVQSIFPAVTSRAAAVRRLFEGPVELDSAGIMQLSVCYVGQWQWTVGVAWGFAVSVIRGTMSAREMEMPARTFLNWYRRADFTAYAFNTRPVARSPCQKPYVYYLDSTGFDEVRNVTVTTYRRHDERRPPCKWKTREPEPSAVVDEIVVYKKADPGLWDRAPRRNCCRVVRRPRNGKNEDKRMVIDVGLCKEGEIVEETVESRKQVARQRKGH